MRVITRRAHRAAAILAVVLVAAAAAGCDLAVGHFKQRETAEWRKSYELQPGGRIEVSNVNGKISVEPSAGNTVEVVAEKSARAASSEAAREALGRIEIQESVEPSNIRIETKLPQAGGLFSGGSLEVRYTLHVPAAADVKVSTINGGIELSGLTGKINAETTNGGVKARDVSGGIQASSTNGGVEVDLSRVPESGVKLECTNGGIELRLPGSAKATISARITNGGIDTGGLPIVTSGESSRRQLNGRLNGGGPRIDLDGTNGGIKISGR